MGNALKQKANEHLQLYTNSKTLSVLKDLAREKVECLNG